MAASETRTWALVMAVGVALTVTPPVRAQAKTAGEAYKNVTQLKEIPADQLMPAMQFISSALGVECGFCHVQGKMEADDKASKKTARRMMAMVAELNKEQFGGRQEVTCYSCHRGAERPVNTPAVLDSDATPGRVPPTAGATSASVDQITVEQIIDRYVAAVGGADAMRKVTSRVLKGQILAGGSETPIEIVTKAPNKRITITHASGGDSFTAFDGMAGWMGSSGRPARQMSAAESGAFGLDAEFYFPLRLKELFPELKVGPSETIGGAECETLIGSGPGHPPVRLSFDKRSGLLLRMVRYAETPLGRNPTQIDYFDYRPVSGVQVPFRWTLARPNGRFTIQIQEAQANVAIDNSRFEKPQ